jgi:hypothetical protein
MGMAVPKASMNKDRQLVPWQHDIRRAWKISTMNSESITQAMKDLTDPNLRARVPLPHRAHNPPPQRIDVLFARLEQ